MDADLDEDDIPTPTPMEVPSRERSSQRAVSFAEQCDVQAARILCGDNDAQVLAGELIAMGAHLRRWQTVPPDEADRRRTTDLFFALMTRAHKST